MLQFFTLKNWERQCSGDRKNLKTDVEMCHDNGFKANRINDTIFQINVLTERQWVNWVKYSEWLSFSKLWKSC